MRREKPKMTKAHYQLVAEVFANFVQGPRFDCCQATITLLAKEFGNTLKGTSPNFNRDRFMDACLLPMSEDRAREQK